MKAQRRLLARYLRHMQPGELAWIGLRPQHKQDMQVVQQARAIKYLGLEGDHRGTKTPGSGRQVTIISEEFISQVVHQLGKAEIAPALLRRNLVVKGVNLNALRYQQFRIGGALFEAGALCDPCSRMEAALGEGGMLAMLGYGGLCCKVLESGEIKLGDAVKVVLPQGELF
jgi:MOSC domain-containing protein YiiM